MSMRSLEARRAAEAEAAPPRPLPIGLGTARPSARPSACGGCGSEPPLMAAGLQLSGRAAPTPVGLGRSGDCDLRPGEEPSETGESGGARPRMLAAGVAATGSEKGPGCSGSSTAGETFSKYVLWIAWRRAERKGRARDHEWEIDGRSMGARWELGGSSVGDRRELGGSSHLEVGGDALQRRVRGRADEAVDEHEVGEVVGPAGRIGRARAR